MSAVILAVFVLAGGALLYSGHAVAGGLVLGTTMAVTMASTRAAAAASTPTADLVTDIAVMGADAFLAQCQLIAGPCPDPGHPGGMPIALWQPPARYGRGVRVLECFNGTRDPRTGLYERLAKGVPAEHCDPLSAAAASYGIDPVTYAQLATRA